MQSNTVAFLRLVKACDNNDQALLTEQSRVPVNHIEQLRSQVNEAVVLEDGLSYPLELIL